jgi:hypothetical protein
MPGGSTGGGTGGGDNIEGGDSRDGNGDGSNDMPKDAPLTADALTAGGNSDNDDNDNDSGGNRGNDDNDDNEPTSKDAPVTTDALAAKKIECPKGEVVSLFSTSCKPAGSDAAQGAALVATWPRPTTMAYPTTLTHNFPLFL